MFYYSSLSHFCKGDCSSLRSTLLEILDWWLKFRVTHYFFRKTMSKPEEPEKLILFLFLVVHMYARKWTSVSSNINEQPRNWFRFRGTFFETLVLTFPRKRNQFHFRFRVKVRTGLRMQTSSKWENYFFDNS